MISTEPKKGNIPIISLIYSRYFRHSLSQKSQNGRKFTITSVARILKRYDESLKNSSFNCIYGFLWYRDCSCNGRDLRDPSWKTGKTTQDYYHLWRRQNNDSVPSDCNIFIFPFWLLTWLVKRDIILKKNYLISRLQGRIRKKQVPGS